MPKDILNKAHEILNALKQSEFPEDDWIGLSDDYDLNLFIDMDGHPAATIYPVVEGRTDITRFYQVKFRLGE